MTLLFLLFNLYIYIYIYTYLKRLMLLPMEHSIARHHSLNSYVNAKNECISLDRALIKIRVRCQVRCPSRKGTHKAPEGKAVHLGLL